MSPNPSGPSFTPNAMSEEEEGIIEMIVNQRVMYAFDDFALRLRSLAKECTKNEERYRTLEAVGELAQNTAKYLRYSLS